MVFFFKYYPGIGHEWLNNYGAVGFSSLSFRSYFGLVVVIKTLENKSCKKESKLNQTPNSKRLKNQQMVV
jgi:hypothetical protein